MATKNLTEKMVARISWTPVSRYQDYSDQSQPNLLLRIGKQSKTFYWKGRLHTGRSAQVKIDAFPNVTLDEAREECRRMSGLVRKKIDPRRTREGMTGRELVDDLIAYPTWKTDRTEARANTLTGYLERSFIPECGELVLDEIDSGHMLDIIDIYRSKGKAGAAGHMWCALSVMWQHAVLRRYVKMNPMFGIKSPKPGEPSDRILDDGELKTIWDSLGAVYQQSFSAAMCLRILMTVPLRGHEAAGARWDEINFETGDWIIPRSRIKTRGHNMGPFVMPLSNTAIEYLEILHQETKGSGWLFPAPKKKDGPISIKIVERFIGRNREGGLYKDMNYWRKHDIRRTIASRMGQLKVDERIISRCLNHKLPGITARSYNMWGYRDEKLDALDMWGKYLMRAIK